MISRVACPESLLRRAFRLRLDLATSQRMQWSATRGSRFQQSLFPSRSFGVTPAEGDADLEDSEHDIDAAARLAKRRARLIEEARCDNPFIANQLSGGGVGASEAAFRRWQRQGHMDDLPGLGKPLPDRPQPPPGVAREDYTVQGIAARLAQERPDMEEGEWRAAITKTSLVDAATRLKRGIGAGKGIR